MSIGGAFNIIGGGLAGLFRSRAGEFTPSIGSVIATAHHARVIAAGGVMPVTAAELASLLNPICTAYNITTTAQFNTQLPTFSDPHWTGYGAGAGAGVTLGQAVQVVYSINPAADAVQTTAASQPLLLTWSGQNYWYSSGVVGNFVSTPNVAANQIWGDMDFRVKLINWTGASPNFAGFFNKGGSAAAFGYAFLATTGKTLSLRLVQGGVANFYSSSVPATITNGWVRVTRNSANGQITHFQSSNGVDWTQVGIVLNGFSGLVQSNTLQLEIGSHSNNFFQGNIEQITLANTIGGAPVVDFNPQLYNAATSQTQWTAATGEAWTINTGTADTGHKGVLVDRTRVQYNGTSHVTRAASFSVNTPTITMYSGFRKFTNAATANGILAELGTNAGTTNGFFLAMNNGIASAETAGCYVALLNARAYSSNSLLRKITTSTYQTLIPDPETGYAVNNVAASSILTIASGNNTGNINQSALNLGARNNGASLFANIGLDSLAVSITNDTTAQRLTMFNTLKTMNRL